jgi:hypothetical protein
MPEEPKRPLKVFLCHASSDKPTVRELYQRLIKDGVDAWLDKEKLLPGQDWEYEIRKAVREADVVVVCLSKQFNQAGFRQKEVRLALDTAMEKPEGEIFIIPARLEECDNLENLRKWHWVDLFEEDGYETLTRALRLRADKIGAMLSRNDPLSKTGAKQERVLEAAIEKEVRVDVPASLFVWIKKLESKSIVSVVGSVDEDVILDEDNVKSKGLEIEFPIEHGQVLPVSISLRLTAYDFHPSTQQKKLIVPPDRDSEVCTFIVTPKKAGNLLLSLEVLKDDVNLAARSLRTIAIESERKGASRLVLVSIPIFVVVQTPTPTIDPSPIPLEDAPDAREETERDFMPSASHYVPKVLDVRPSSPQSGMLHLFGRSGEWSERFILIPEEGLSIGRSEDNDLRMIDRNVSRYHARIFVMRSWIYIRDENSTLGTYVNDQRIATDVPVRLKHGDVIRIGRYEVFELRIE